MKDYDKFLEPMAEVVENDSTLNNQSTTTASSAELVDGAAETARIRSPKSTYELYLMTKRKADKKKAEKKRKKKKKEGQAEKYPCPVSVMPSGDFEETFLFRHEIANNQRTTDLLQFSKISEQIRRSQGKAISDPMKLELDSDSGVFLGMLDHSFYVGKHSRADGHICVIGESGRGKTESIVKPTMLTNQDGITIAFDFKSDLYGHWLRTVKYLGKRCCLFSLGTPGEWSCHYDPLAVLRQNDSSDIVSAATILAQTLIPLPEGAKDPVWINAARAFLTGAIIYYFGLELNFPEIMSLVLNRPITETIKEIMDSGNNSDDDDDIDCAGFARVFINKLADVDQKVLGNIGMELSQLGVFNADMGLIDLLTPEDGSELLDWYKISTSPEPIDVIISVPEAKLDYFKPVLRLMVSQLISTLEQRPQRTFSVDTELPPVLVLLDEFARLGKFPSITNGLMTLRSAGVTFAIFIQSVASLDEIYGHTTARAILDNCTFKVILGASDVESQQYFSNLVGSVETLSGSISENYNLFTGQVTGYSRNIGTRREPILYPHEFGILSDVIIVSPEGYFRVEKVPYYSHKELFTQLALFPRHKKYMQEYDRNHAISALPERSNHE